MAPLQKLLTPVHGSDEDETSQKSTLSESTSQKERQDGPEPEKTNFHSKESTVELANKDTIEQHLKVRQGMLRLLENTTSKEEMKLLNDYEESFRKYMLQLSTSYSDNKVDEKETTSCSDDRVDEKESEANTTKPSVTKSKETITPAKKKKNEESSTVSGTSTSIPFCERLRRQAKFEMKYAIPGAFGLLVFCFTHVACFELFSLIVVEPTKDLGMDETVNLIVLIFSLILARLSGGVFGWISEEKEDQVEDMEEEGECQEFIEMAVFRKRKGLKEFASLASLFLCYVSVGFFYQGRFIKVLDEREDILEGLPSLKQGTSTHISDLLATKQQGFLLAARQRELLLSESELGEQLPGVCNRTIGFCRKKSPSVKVTKSETDLALQDEDYFFDEVTLSSYNSILGDAENPVLSPEVTFGYYLTGAIIGVALMKKIGIPLD